MRLFVSIELPEHIVEEVHRVQKEFKQLCLFEGKYIETTQLHITLTFFGSVETQALDKIKQGLSTVVLPPFEVAITRLGLNSSSKPHVLWIEVESAPLTLLANTIAILFPKYQEQRAFNAHITIARIKKVCDKPRLKESVSSFQVSPHSWKVEEFSLWQSETFQEGPEYTKLMSFPLQ